MNEEQPQQYQTVPKYDRLRGSLKDVGVWSRPSTTQSHQTLTGFAETFVVVTARHPDQGDTIFIECIDENRTVTRLALPPKVADIIASQRDSLTTIRRKNAARTRAKLLTEDDKKILRERLAEARKAPRRKKRKGKGSGD